MAIVYHRNQATTLSDLPPELLYSILSYAVADVLFDYLFTGPLAPREELEDSAQFDRPNPAAVNVAPPTALRPVSTYGDRQTDINLDNLSGDRNGQLHRIISLGSVSTTWRIVLSRILKAVLHDHHSPSLDGTVNEAGRLAQSLACKNNQQDGCHMIANQNSPHDGQLFVPRASSAHPHSSSTFTGSHAVSNGAHLRQIQTPASCITPFPVVVSYLYELRNMEGTLRTLLQSTIDSLRLEQDQTSTSNNTPTPMGLNTPPPPVTALPNTTIATPSTINSSLVPLPGTLAPIVSSQVNANSNLNTIVVPQVFPLFGSTSQAHTLTSGLTSGLHPSHHQASLSNLLFSTLPSSSPVEEEGQGGAHGSSESCPVEQGPSGRQMTVEMMMTIPLFMQAFSYTQASIFTLPARYPPSISSLFSNNNSHISSSNGSPVSHTHRRTDLSLLSLNMSRLSAAAFLVNLPFPSNSSSSCYMKKRNTERICPKEVAEVVQLGLDQMTDKLYDAMEVCRWNDLLTSVFVHGERSEKALQEVSDCFDKLDDHASTLPMYYLLRTGLYKTITLIGRSRPITVLLPSYPSSDSLSTYPSPSSSFVSTPSPLSSAYSGSGEEWKERAAALSWCWTGRVIESAEL